MRKIKRTQIIFNNLRNYQWKTVQNINQYQTNLHPFDTKNKGIFVANQINRTGNTQTQVYNLNKFFSSSPILSMMHTNKMNNVKIIRFILQTQNNITLSYSKMFVSFSLRMFSMTLFD